MKALGLIEVYGYLTAVEALDSALKAANVSLLDTVCVRGGLVTVLVVGDVGAVKAAMDASAAAAERVGQVLSVHVIPRPVDDIGRMLGNGPQKGPSGPAPEPPKPESSTEEEVSQDGKEQLSLTEEEDEPQAEPVDLHTFTPEKLEDMTVVHLRALARSIGLTSMTRKQIRFAKKEELIEKITEFCGQEG